MGLRESGLWDGDGEVPNDMIDESAIHAGGGASHPGRVGRGGRGWSLFLALALWVSSSAAMAVEIVEVRVGRHAKFTRVVFELDRVAGYRIERSDPASGVSELIVTLEATSIPRRIESSKTFIEHVDITASGTRSIARIRLARDGLRLKEMILASPPRIVLDLLADEPVVAEVARAPKPPVPTTSTKPATPPVPTPPTPPTPPMTPMTAEPVPRESEPAIVVAQLPDPEPAPEPVVEFDEFEPAPFPGFQDEPAEVVQGDVVAAAEELAGSDEGEEAWDGEQFGGANDEPSSSTPIEPEGIDEFAELAPPQPMPAVEPAARPMIAKTTPDGGVDWMIWALAAVGVVLMLLGGLVVARGRSGGAVDYVDEDDAADPDATSLMDVNPFADMNGDGDQPLMGGEDTTVVQSMGMDVERAFGSGDAEEKQSESVVFDDSAEASMDAISQDNVNESLGMPPTIGGIPEEFQQMMRDMSSRVEALEGRIDELVDARDRLERQVAAQTEELRVQRAAIARTQRAVRNLARPEDEEPEPTEPALREPGGPSSNG